MKELIEQIGIEARKGLDRKTALEPENKRRTPRSTEKVVIGILIICGLLLCLSAYWVLDSIDSGTKAMVESYKEAKATADEEQYRLVYDESFNESFNDALREHGVSNKATVSMGEISEKQSLEVLKVYDVTYSVTKPGDESWLEGITKSFGGKTEMESWLEVPGNGVFTVNLRAGEFIVDEERNTVLIRVPGPELTQFTIDYENVEILNFEEGGIFKNSAKFGVDKAIEQLQESELTMMQTAKNNQDFYKRARNSAEKMLINLVKQLNPLIPDLQVKVEFFD